jgi:valyl-tRNA synthetase
MLGGMPYDSPDDPLEARWIIAELHSAATEVNRSLEAYRYDDAANAIYKFFWGSFCDWYLEIVKLRLIFDDPAKRDGAQAALSTLVSVFEASLRLLSPFMPFITEEVWHTVYDGNPPVKSIALTQYPAAGKLLHHHESAINIMTMIQSLIDQIRGLRKEVGLAEKAVIPVELRIEPEPVMESIKRNHDIIERLARVGEIRFVDQISLGLTSISTLISDVAVVYEPTTDVPAERARLTKDIAQYEKGLASAERQLGNEGFLKKAPPQVVEGLKKQEAETRLLLEKARAALESLPKES